MLGNKICSIEAQLWLLPAVNNNWSLIIRAAVVFRIDQPPQLVHAGCVYRNTMIWPTHVLILCHYSIILQKYFAYLYDAIITCRTETFALKWNMIFSMTIDYHQNFLKIWFWEWWRHRSNRWRSYSQNLPLCKIFCNFENF